MIDHIRQRDAAAAHPRAFISTTWWDGFNDSKHGYQYDASRRRSAYEYQCGWIVGSERAPADPRGWEGSAP